MTGIMATPEDVIRALYEIDPDLGRESERPALVDGLVLADHYTTGLSTLYKRLHPDDAKATLLLLETASERYHKDPLLEALGSPPQLILLASEKPYGGEFFRLVEQRYAFMNDDSGSGLFLSDVEGWGSDRKPIGLPNADQAVLVAAKIMMRPYVEALFDDMPGHDYLERLGFFIRS